MPTDDLYAVLQVQPSADADVLRAAYRALAQKRHPDAGGSEQATADLNRAWAVLSDPRARTAYDRRRAIAATRAAAVAAARARNAAPVGAPLKTLDFGRYKGWSLVQLAQEDPEYLRWLAQTPSGRLFRADIDALLGDTGRLSRRTLGFTRRASQVAR